VLKQIESCPSCSGSLEIREFYCPVCDIQVRGRFAPGERSPFAALSDEQEAFLRLFVLSRGNLSDVERSLGVSYPTVRAKLDDLIAAVSALEEQAAQASAPAAEPAPEHLSRTEILARVADGRLSSAEGMALLQQLSSAAGTAG
jgi:hypothetical protein